MAGSRISAAPARKPAMRPPPRPSSSRAQSVAPRNDRSGAASPADSVASATLKRKERDFEREMSEETNINVVVRCRGRNDREVRENSAVVLTTDGVKGKTVELSMGPSALSNKTYYFDKVFAPAADQSMIHDDVVIPILDEMLAGFNCTIFAYGQTGTGKTYTMSGNMATTAGMLSEDAGIIPRTLYGLFNKLELDDVESSVKCSFIELYNEELRDLISADEGAKLKIYDDTSKKGHSSTIVQGMEESFIRSASEGVKLLQKGSHRRQVAATKCNDLSSRSHTVFTVTVHTKRTAESGEEYMSIGKLNLVDLAGSENIQRSGAENKRAAEAGLINKSLLTLGRVINALVDRSPHVPYRESKLTRLLQDSLGGRTKTCIIATVSPAKSNLEETISTLDYAFRAKNIRNKPQINPMMNKKTLLKEYTSEIEKLKSELIATRQRNGVYLSNENFEQLTTEAESQKILSEEQAVKIEAMEINLRNKVQELFTMTNTFMTMKKETEATKLALDQAKSVLEQTEIVLAATQRSLDEETILRKAHQETEEKLSIVGKELVSTIGETVDDIGQLRKKIKRKSDLQSMNRNTWSLSKAQVNGVTSLVESRVEEFQLQQQELLAGVSNRMQTFVRDELEKLATTQASLEEKAAVFDTTEQEVLRQSTDAKEDMDSVLEEIKTLRESVKERVGQGLQGLSSAAERISAEIVSELEVFHSQLHGSYSIIGKESKRMFEELHNHLNSQRSEVNNLKEQLRVAGEAAMLANSSATSKLDTMLAEEREQASKDRQDLLSQITALIATNGMAQDQRLSSKIDNIRQEISSAKSAYEESQSSYSKGMQTWDATESRFLDRVWTAREEMKNRLKDDWMTANKHHSTIQTATQSVHQQTIQIVDDQMKAIDGQMQALDEFVTRARAQNAQHHAVHSASLQSLSTTAKISYESIGIQLSSTYERTKSMGEDVAKQQTLVEDLLPTLNDSLCRPLSDLRNNVDRTRLQEYEPTGETPQKLHYSYPTALPRTESHEDLLAQKQPSEVLMSPSKTAIFSDPIPESMIDDHTPINFSASLPPRKFSQTLPGLREINVNVLGTARASSPEVKVPQLSASLSVDNPVPLLRRSTRDTVGKKLNKKSGVVVFEGRENTVSNQSLSQSTGRRRSPRTAA